MVQTGQSRTVGTPGIYVLVLEWEPSSREWPYRALLKRATRHGLGNFMMGLLTAGPLLSLTAIGEGETGPSPPGTARVESLFVTVGIAIFLALLVGAIVILIRKHQRR